MRILMALLRGFSWREWLHHPWRHLSAVVAIMLGVALAFSVHLINASALDEFSSAVSSVNGEPDLSLRARQGHLPDAWLERVARHPQVAAASPVLERSTAVLTGSGQKIPVKLVGVDALSVVSVSPALMPRMDTATGSGRLDLFAPDAVFLNPRARQVLAAEIEAGGVLRVQTGLSLSTVRVAGTVNAPGAPLLVMDVAAAQALMQNANELSRIDLRLQPGTSVPALLADWQWPDHMLAQRPEQNTERISNLSRAYRVNLTVLALVALFTGAFLVFSVLSLSVARRQQSLALLGVLGLSARERLQLVLIESAVLGLLGSALGIALGSALAALALQWLGGDLGGGFFAGVAPALQWQTTAALGYGVLGVTAALVGGWWPARHAAGLAPALALKGLGRIHEESPTHPAWALCLMALAAVLSWLPPVAGIPLAAYVSVGLLLISGLMVMPLVVGVMLQHLAPRCARHALPLLAIERSRRMREMAAVATSGVVASLALSVALTVMVASFRDSVTQWLDRVLPAPLYVRAGSSTGEGNTLPPGFAQAVAALPGVERVDAQRSSPLQLMPNLPPVTLLARPLSDREGRHQPDQYLPLLGKPLQAPAGSVAVYVSEAMQALHSATVGQDLPALAWAFPAAPPDTRYFVAGVWRDYARQHGSIVIDMADFVRLSGDQRINDLALYLHPDASEASVSEALRSLAQTMGASDLMELASASQIRGISLNIFDRSFAVTYWLQAVAIGIGLFGVAASFSAQVLTRRREFGLLAHLGLTRRDILRVVAWEGLAWTTLGALAGLALGLGVSLILVHVVNPQSFHWSMDLSVPWLRLLLLCAAVIVAGTATAWLAGRSAASQQAVQAVKEDW